MPAIVEDLEILHSCFERGVQLQLFLQEQIDLSAYSQEKGFMEYKNKQSGFFSFNQAELICITGNHNTQKIKVMYSYYLKEKCRDILDKHFIGFSDLYQFYLKSFKNYT
ncbi:MAG: hypothetical protein AAF518_22230 [Spirochaetota bacterium]